MTKPLSSSVPAAVACSLSLAFVATLAQPAAAPAATEPQTEAAKLHALFDSDWETFLEHSPISASYLGDRRYNDRMPDLSPKAREAARQRTRDSLKRLLAIDRSRLDAADQLSYDIYKTLLEDDIAGQRFHSERMPIGQAGGPHTFGNLTDQLSFTTAKDYADWIARLEAFGTYVDGTMALMREGMESGWMPPKVTMQRVPAQLERAVKAAPEEGSFYAPFKEMPKEIPAAEAEKLRTRARAAITGTVLPALARLRAFFNDTYFPAARESIAAGELPDGKAYYDYLAHSYTTTDLTADQIHEIGLKEVARLRAEMEKVKAEVGFEGDLPAFFQHLRTDPKFFYTSPDALLEAYRALAKRVDPELVKDFRTMPRTPYGVRPIPDDIAPDTTTAYYDGPAADGSRAGYYSVNLYKPETRPKWEMVPLSLHEAVPGHHFQIALALELPEQPMFRRVSGFTAFVEGWGLYAEGLADELGLYSGDLERFGMLSFDSWRACRLVVDTGMHAKGWTRQQAIDYFKANAAKTELDITNEVDRYITTPGQALAYKVGQMKISELRARASERLGARFDVRGFHDAVLGGGALPLNVLERRVDAWIEAEAAKPAPKPAAGR